MVKRRLNLLPTKRLVLVVRDEHVLDSSGNKVDKKFSEGVISQVMTALTGEREMKRPG